MEEQHKMAIRIQLRRDTAANWTSANPTLRAGEVGIETDTLKFKIGNGTQTWTQITTYANVTPSSLTSSLSDYILAADQGTAGGPAELDSNGDLIVPENSIILWNDADYDYITTLTATQPTANRTITIPNATGTMALTSDLSPYAPLSGATFTGNINVPTSITFEGATADSYETTIQVTDPTADRTINFPDAGGTVALTTNIPSTTDNLSEGSTNKYYTDERAQDAIATAIAAGTHTNITITYDDDNNKFTFVGANTYSDENAQDAVGNALGTGLSYNDTTGAISVDTTSIQARVADVSDTEIGYLNGVTSGIQTQIDNKASLSGATFTGAVSGTSLTLSGDLTVNGTTTTLNSTTISVDDKNIELGSVATPSDATADGGGITLKGATDKTFNWVDATDAWTSSEHINLASGKSLYLNGTLLKDATETLTNKTLTSPKINEDVAVTATATELNILDGVTSSTAELNILDGATLSTTELNYVDGVTSAIQTQIDTKVSKNGGDTITASSASTIPLIIKGAASRSVALQDWQTSDGTSMLKLTDTTLALGLGSAANTSGFILLGGAYAGFGAAEWYIRRDGGNLRIQSPAGSQMYAIYDSIALSINGHASQTYDLQQWKNSGGTVLSKVDASGNITAPSLTLSTTALATTSGGTGLSSYTSGDVLYASATNTLAKLAKGTDGQILTLASGVPSWAAAPITLPTQTDNSGKYLTTDGSTASWATLVVPIETGTATVTANTATTLDTTALSAFTSIEYMVSLKQGSKIRTSKVVVQTDGTSVDMTEFAITETGGTIAGVVVSAAVSSTNAVLQLTATDATSTNVTVKFSKVKL